MKRGGEQTLFKSGGRGGKGKAFSKIIVEATQTVEF